MKSKTISLLFILAIAGLISLGIIIDFNPSIKVGKVLEMETIKSMDAHQTPHLIATILLCKNKKEKKYQLQNREIWQRLRINKIVKFKLKWAGSKTIARIIED